MPQVDYLPFGTGAGANVEDQPSYAADTDRALGFSAGIARSAKANKVWRQASVTAAAVAGFISDQIGLDMLDDGDVASYKTKMENAVIALIRQSTLRTVLTGDLDLYVAVSGNDNNDGSVTRPFASLQAAWNWIQQRVDPGGYQVNVHVGNGVYTKGLDAQFVCPAAVGPFLNFIGNVNDPSLVVISTHDTIPFLGGIGVNFTVAGFTLSNNQPLGDNANGSCIACWDYGTINVYNMNFGAASRSHMLTWGGMMIVYGNILVQGDPGQIAMKCHIETGIGSVFQVDAGTYTFIGTRTMDQFVWCRANSTYIWGGSEPTWSGTLIAKKYLVTENAVIINGTSATMPGNQAGQTGTGGIATGIDGGGALLSAEEVAALPNTILSPSRMWPRRNPSPTFIRATQNTIEEMRQHGEIPANLIRPQR